MTNKKGHQLFLSEEKVHPQRNSWLRLWIFYIKFIVLYLYYRPVTRGFRSSMIIPEFLKTHRSYSWCQFFYFLCVKMRPQTVIFNKKNFSVMDDEATPVRTVATTSHSHPSSLAAMRVGPPCTINHEHRLCTSSMYTVILVLHIILYFVTSACI